MITEISTTDPIFARLDRRHNPLHGCGPNLSSIYKRGASTSLRNQYSSTRSNTQHTRSSFRCLRIEGHCPQVTDPFKHAIPGQCWWCLEGLRTFIHPRPSTTTSMADKLPLGHSMCSVYPFK
jgi:hypothetical protein